MKGHLQCGHRLNSNSDHTSGGPRKTLVLEKLSLSARVLMTLIMAEH